MHQDLTFRNPVTLHLWYFNLWNDAQPFSCLFNYLQCSKFLNVCLIWRRPEWTAGFWMWSYWCWMITVLDLTVVVVHPDCGQLCSPSCPLGSLGLFCRPAYVHFASAYADVLGYSIFTSGLCICLSFNRQLLLALNQDLERSSLSSYQRSQLLFLWATL